MPSNITLDDTSPELIYTGIWDPNAYPSSRAFNGSHSLSYDPTATVTLNFKGIAVYFWSPLWPYLVNITLTLDNTTSVQLDLTDYDSINIPNVGLVETVLTQVRWSMTGLEDKNHTLVASMVPGSTYLVFDAVTYTVSYHIPSPGAQRARTVGIALGTTLGLIVFAGLLFSLYFWFFLRGSRRWRDWRNGGGHARVQSGTFNLENEMEGFPKQRPGSVWVEPTPPQLVPHPYSFSSTPSQASGLDQYSAWVGLGPLASRVRVDDPSPQTEEGWVLTPSIDEDMDDSQLDSSGARRGQELPPGAAQPYMFVSNRIEDDDDAASDASSTRTRVQQGPFSVTTKSDAHSRQS